MHYQYFKQFAALFFNSACLFFNSFLCQYFHVKDTPWINAPKLESRAMFERT